MVQAHEGRRWPVVQESSSRSSSRSSRIVKSTVGEGRGGAFDDKRRHASQAMATGSGSGGGNGKRPAAATTSARHRRVSPGPTVLPAPRLGGASVAGAGGGWGSMREGGGTGRD
ncbi:unnamed protein product [Lampetra fluviatilis]